MYQTLSIVFLRLIAVYMSLDLFAGFAYNVSFGFHDGFEYYVFVALIWDVMTIGLSFLIWVLAPKMSSYILKDIPLKDTEIGSTPNEVLSICKTIIIATGLIVLTLSFKPYSDFMTNIIIGVFITENPLNMSKLSYLALLIIPYTFLAYFLIFKSEKTLTKLNKNIGKINDK